MIVGECVRERCHNIETFDRMKFLGRSPNLINGNNSRVSERFFKAVKMVLRARLVIRRHKHAHIKDNVSFTVQILHFIFAGSKKQGRIFK